MARRYLGAAVLILKWAGLDPLREAAMEAVDMLATQWKGGGWVQTVVGRVAYSLRYTLWVLAY
jgi:hypothetical protein